MDKKLMKVKASYEELKGALGSIEGQDTWMDDVGFCEHTNRVIDRLGQNCDLIEGVDEYKIQTRFSKGRGEVIDVIPAKTKINSLLGRLKGLYDFAETNSPGSGHTFIQQQSQSQEQHQSIILDLQERVIEELPKHQEGSKERGFLEKLKATLPTMGNTLGILASILNIASEFDVDPEAVRSLLNL